MKLLRIFGIMVVALFVPVLVMAAGPHDGLSCVGCHGMHDAKGEIIFAVEPNKKALNPRTKQPFTGITALCLGCHETMERGGMGITAVSASHSHPYGVTPNAKVATVPHDFLRDGKLECVGCHDPHPSNPNYKYLRVDTAKGANMGSFCAMCHSSKSDRADLKSMKIFSSMDERTAAPQSVPVPMADPASAAPKKK